MFLFMGFLGMFLLMGVLAIFLAIIALILFTVWTVFIFSARPRHVFLIWLGVPVLVILMVIGLCWADSFYDSLPGVVFPDSVGFDPPPDVVVVNSLQHEPIDWVDSYLEFYASDATIERILKDGFVLIPYADIIDYQTDPEWWKPPTGPDIRVYVMDIDDPELRDRQFNFSNSRKLLIYDPDSGNSGKRHVYFRYRH